MHVSCERPAKAASNVSPKEIDTHKVHISLHSILNICLDSLLQEQLVRMTGSYAISRFVRAHAVVTSALARRNAN